MSEASGEDKIASSIGAVISINCGGDGYYQGRLEKYSKTNRSITIGRPLKNGIPLGRSLEIYHHQIQSLRVLKTASEASEDADWNPIPAEPTPPPAPKTPKTSKVPKPSTTAPQPPSIDPIALLTKGTAKMMSAAAEETTIKVSRQQKKARAGSEKIRTDTDGCSVNGLVDARNGSNRGEWVSRPLGTQRRRRATETQMSPSDSNRTSPTCDEAEEATDIAPTPIFRKFEPQVPHPTNLEDKSMRYSKSKRNAGPSGIPSLDAARGRRTGKTSDLNRPLDMDLLDTDFDFEENLKQFSKDENDEEDDEFYENVEKQKMSANFAHYENIIDDPTRCTSWTNVISKNAYSEYDSEAPDEGRGRSIGETGSSKGKRASADPARRRRSSVSRRLVISQWAATPEGLRLPVLDEKEKARLTRETRSFLGEEAYSLILADRVLQWIFHVIANNELIVERVALVCGEGTTSPILLDRLLIQLTGRGCRVSLFGGTLDKALPLVELIDNESNLPSDVQMVIDLDPSMQQKSRSAELMRWIAAQHSASVVCLDHVCTHVAEQKRVHALMVGAMSTSVVETLKQKEVVPRLGSVSVAALFGAVAGEKEEKARVALADMGVPFAWFGEESADALSNLFATSFVAPVNVL